MKYHYVYILFSLKDNRLYTGYTTNLDRRILEHQKGNVSATKNRLPIKLIYFETYLDPIDAQNREKYLKSGGKAKNDLKLQLQQTLTIHRGVVQR